MVLVTIVAFLILVSFFVWCVKYMYGVLNEHTSKIDDLIVHMDDAKYNDEDIQSLDSHIRALEEELLDHRPTVKSKAKKKKKPTK